MFRKKQPKAEITVVSLYPGLYDDVSVRPVPANKFYPEWWKNMPTNIPLTESKYKVGGTAKACPSFVQWFSKGLIIPAWCDISLIYKKETETWEWGAGRNSQYSIGAHGKYQFLDHADYLNQGLNAEFTFKLTCPWNIITPKGWSVLQLPLFYHSNQDWTVLPGIIDTDVYHQIHQQVMYYGKGKEVFIPKGSPLVHYMPFERTKTTIDVREFTLEDKRRFDSDHQRIESKFRKGYKDLER
jgi:hypothetical protein